MIPGTGETDRPAPKPELEDGVKIEVNVDASPRGSIVSTGTLPGQSKEELQQTGEKEVFSEEGGAQFRTLSWPYGKFVKTELLYCWC